MDYVVATNMQYRYGRIEYKFERNLDGVQGAQILANLQAQARAVEIARLRMIERRVHARMSTEAHDRLGKSMFLAAQIRKAGYTAKRQAVPILRKLARDFDERTFELFRLGWLDKLPATCEMYVTKVLDQRIAELDAAEKNKCMVRLAPCTERGAIHAQ